MARISGHFILTFPQPKCALRIDRQRILHPFYPWSTAHLQNLVILHPQWTASCLYLGWGKKHPQLKPCRLFQRYHLVRIVWLLPMLECLVQYPMMMMIEMWSIPLQHKFCRSSILATNAILIWTTFHQCRSIMCSTLQPNRKIVRTTLPALILVSYLSQHILTHHLNHHHLILGTLVMLPQRPNINGCPLQTTTNKTSNSILKKLSNSSVRIFRTFFLVPVAQCETFFCHFFRVTFTPKSGFVTSDSLRCTVCLYTVTNLWAVPGTHSMPVPTCDVILVLSLSPSAY